jgi:hypothetical protein
VVGIWRTEMISVSLDGFTPRCLDDIVDAGSLVNDYDNNLYACNRSRRREHMPY